MDHQSLLKDLAKRLMTPGLPSQVEIGRGAGVDQPLVSRARKGQLIRYTDRVKRLDEYVTMRVAMLPHPSSNRPRGRRNAGVAVDREVMDRCRDFLAGGGDPNLLLDQLALLRRAVSSTK